MITFQKWFYEFCFCEKLFICAFWIQEDDMNFSVPSSTGAERYHVSMDIGFCSCPEGVSGQRCVEIIL